MRCSYGGSPAKKRNLEIPPLVYCSPAPPLKSYTLGFDYTAIADVSRQCFRVGLNMRKRTWIGTAGSRPFARVRAVTA